MNDNKKTMWIVGGIIGVLLLVVVGGNFFINKIADRVIVKLQKDYSPSPYSPGLDPDRIEILKK